MDDGLTVKSAKPGEATPKGKVAIPGGTAKRQSPANPNEFWMNYYKNKDEKAKDLLDKVMLLRSEGKMTEVEAVLRGYLTYHSTQAQPWMYQTLLLAVELRKGSPEEVKTLLGYAAILARRNARESPDQLVQVADMLYMRKIYGPVGVPGNLTTCGELLDLAAANLAHRPEPVMMSINLALKTSDARRMGDSVDRLLSLGWPDIDENLRRDARKQVEDLAKTLKEDGKAAEADGLLARLPESESRDLYIRLKWSGEADLDLVVDEPLGATAKFLTRRTVFGGALVKTGFGSKGEEIYVCPRGFDGEYKVSVETIVNDEKASVKEATLEIITSEGAANEAKDTQKIYVAKVGERTKPIAVTLKGGRRTETLPFVSSQVNIPKLGEPKPQPAAKPAAPKAKAAPKAGAAPIRP